jgi:hypothetical protein
MPDPENSLRSFFEQYAQATNQMHAATIAGFYADNFIAAGPKGNMVFKNDEKFLQWLDQLKDFNHQTGMRNLRIVKYEETSIGKYYRMVIIEWGATFRKSGEELVTFEISYFADITKQAAKVIMYIAHEDQEDYMRERGLL